MKITILVDNNSAEPLGSEHGLSMFLEAGGSKVLFDAGKTELLADNAEKLGVDLSSPDYIVLSHGHYDHTGGLAYALSKAKNAKLYCHEGLLKERYSLKSFGARSVGAQKEAREAIENLPSERKIWYEQPLTIPGGFNITGTVPRITAFEDTGGNYYLDREGRYLDELEDDISLWVETPRGLVIVLGCCHSGIVNTIRRIQDISEKNKIDTVVGGMHLIHADEERLRGTVEDLRQMDIKRILPCHCTGDYAAEYLKNNLNCEVQKAYAGMKLEIE
ncbi:MBL fold metallo-hydrolase [Sedimentisphaera salicampi]|uniref:Putative metal-dependent RNase n=1 Tax=Sedimentisphaera salicampi TaxID=1941349 RepID=A0A1W6LMT9_9BACT|nr:MBL fold metallo-hydrolase [Sedimentisphaera salicampi]ARN57062.1 putative metal-dependent RNase [Sedimentisphaera salicampi]